MQLLDTIIFDWTVAGFLPLVSGFPANYLTYTDPIPTDGADQIGLFVTTTPSGGAGGTDGNAYIRVAWAGAIPGSGQPTMFVEDSVESPSTTTSGTWASQRFSIVPKEYGPFSTTVTTRGAIWVPAAAHFFKIGCYVDAAVTLNARVRIIVERARVGSPTGMSRTS